jgi:hypothetical protein
VAERIAASLQACGNRVELLHVYQVPDLGAYDAFVFGRPVFNQHWLPEPEQFVKRNREALTSRLVWLFSVGTFDDRKRVIGPLIEPKDMRALERAIHPRDYRVSPASSIVTSGHSSPACSTTRGAVTWATTVTGPRSNNGLRDRASPPALPTQGESRASPGDPGSTRAKTPRAPDLLSH